MAKSKKWIIVSNRLPFRWDPNSQRIEPSAGGLVTAVGGISADIEKLWVGSLPSDGETREWAKNVEGSRRRKYHPVFIPDALYDEYYNGMCNDVLWPLLHYESSRVQFRDDQWRAYVEVNKQFARAILEVARDDDLIWVHDFHLFLLPKFLKRRNPRLRIGLFLHVPFPSSEVFRQLPVREEILDAVLYADLIGFHDYSYLRHFINTIYYVLGIESSMLSVRNEGRTTRLGVFPVSIDVQDFKRQAALLPVTTHLRKLKQSQPYEKLVLGVDRLDYIKGIELKLKAFREMLRQYPDMRHSVGLLQIAVPSRVDIPGYIELKYEIEQLVGEINGEFGKPNYVPVQYIFASVSFHELLALYRHADALLVTSKRDGMNLVALEYIVSQPPNDPGVVILSEFAGAISMLSHVIPTNPWDINRTALNIRHALTMNRSERVEGHRSMMRYLDTYSATDWANSFMSNLDASGGDPEADRTQTISVRERSNPAFKKLREFIGNRKVLICLDYDGTLVPIVERPELAVLPPSQRQALRRLLKDDRVELVVVSGRDSKFLDAQLGGLNIAMAAEHGVQYCARGAKRWQTLIRSDRQQWYRIARQVMKDYTARVPDSFIERKQFAISWHYRQSPAEFAAFQARKLKSDLEDALSGLPVAVVFGKKVVEVKAVEANKGAFYSWYTKNQSEVRGRAVLAIGDDATDEDLFSSAASDGVSIKVGEGATIAPFRLERQEDVVPLLLKLINPRS